MVGYPSETEKDFEDTKNLLRRYSHLAYTKKIQIGITPTFGLLNNSPLLNNTDLSKEYGLAHNSYDNSSKFWTSTKYIDNDYPTRSRRWKELVGLVEELGYIFTAGMAVEKWHKEIEGLDKIYNETTSKVFAIRSN